MRLHCIGGYCIICSLYSSFIQVFMSKRRNFGLKTITGERFFVLADFHSSYDVIFIGGLTPEQHRNCVSNRMQTSVMLCVSVSWCYLSLHFHSKYSDTSTPVQYTVQCSTPFVAKMIHTREADLCTEATIRYQKTIPL